MEIPKMSALGNLMVEVAHKINYSVFLTPGNLQLTLDEVFHVGS
jgi:hypothetical protein|nr:hypothetical protein [Nostoc sp. EkiNYC01]